MQKKIFTVKSNVQIAPDVFDMTLTGGGTGITAPGQFVNAEIDGVYLRRPFSVCDYTDDDVRIVYKTVGKGTRILAEYGEGREADLLLPLGNGFDASKAGDSPLLIGGGVGTPPLLGLAKALKRAGKTARAVLGFNTQSEIILYDEFCEALGGDNVTLTTADGSRGVKGFVTDADLSGSFVYSCGPVPMLKAVAQRIKCGAELSFESRMGCGFGACMGCSMMTKNGAKRVCKEGPVFDKEEIIW